MLVSVGNERVISTIQSLLVSLKQVHSPNPMVADYRRTGIHWDEESWGLKRILRMSIYDVLESHIEDSPFSWACLFKPFKLLIFGTYKGLE